MAPPDPTLAAIVLAGGAGTRLGLDGGRNKVYLPLGGLPILAWSLRTLDPLVVPGGLVVVVRAGDEDEARDAIGAAGTTREPLVVAGGATRTASEAAGIASLRPLLETGRIDVVLVHDGARPFASSALVRRLAVAARDRGAAIPALPPQPGTVAVDADGTLRPVDPTRLRRVQTPQAIRTAELLAAYDLAARDGIEGADTAEVVAACEGPPAVVVDGEVDNVKVTTPEDVDLADAIAARLASG